MSIINCILGYLKSKEESSESLDIKELDYLSSPHRIYWQIYNIYNLLIECDKLSFVNQHLVNLPDRSMFTIKFNSRLGSVGIMIGRTVDKIVETYDMTYIGANNQTMFNIKDGKFIPEKGFSKKECELAIEELLAYLKTLPLSEKEAKLVLNYK